VFRSTGWLKVYESERSSTGTQSARDLLDKLGTPYDVLDASQIHDLERNLARQLGDSVPLDTERGYHLVPPESTQTLLSRPCLLHRTAPTGLLHYE
jgi:hypothetical protein